MPTCTLSAARRALLIPAAKTAAPAKYCNDVQYAPINANGSVGTFTTNSTYFAVPRAYHKAMAVGGYLYISGGLQAASSTTCKNSGTNVYCNDIQYAPINANGSVGTFTTNTQYLDFVRLSHGMVSHNGKLYVTGGATSASITGCKDTGTSNVCSDVYYAPISANPSSSGSVGTTTQQTNAFTTARHSHTSVVNNGYLYIIGGKGTGGTFNDIQYCPINSNGSVGTCTQQTSAFTTARSGHTSFLIH